ncbi:MAG: 4Fe-4S binding protein [Candidatus Aenigmarchaeota archaeon]|nr:4Fe-4S binding protein [Candidatus Aenigmarchaeota archaeon]
MSILIEALKSLFKKPFTRMYPKEKLKPCKRFRGRINYYPERCIGCRMCERYCPVGAVKFKEKGKIDFDLGICVLCGMCQDVCPTKPKAINIRNDFEFSSSDKKKLVNLTKKQ